MPESDPSETIAAAIHNHYRNQAKIEGWVMKYDQPWEELPPEIQKANLAAAERLPTTLGVAGIEVVSCRESNLSREEAAVLLESAIDKAAEKEHEGWIEEKSESGWTYAPERNDEAKQHPSMIPWGELSEEEKEKDRSAVRGYLAIVELAGMGFRER